MLTNDAINERYERSGVITKTLLLHQSLTLSFLIRYKRFNGNIYDSRRCVKKANISYKRVLLYTNTISQNILLMQGN